MYPVRVGVGKGGIAVVLGFNTHGVFQDAADLLLIGVRDTYSIAFQSVVEAGGSETDAGNLQSGCAGFFGSHGGNVHAGKVIEGRIRPVSYTHLDVYKRQA